MTDQLDLLAAVPTGLIREPESRIVEQIIRDVAAEHDGVIDQNVVRERLRGLVFHKVIGPTYSRLRRAGVICEDGANRSTDHAGRNAGRWQPLYRLIT